MQRTKGSVKSVGVCDLTAPQLQELIRESKVTIVPISLIRGGACPVV